MWDRLQVLGWHSISTQHMPRIKTIMAPHNQYLGFRVEALSPASISKMTSRTMSCVNPFLHSLLHGVHTMLAAGSLLTPTYRSFRPIWGLCFGRGCPHRSLYPQCKPRARHILGAQWMIGKYARDSARSEKMESDCCRPHKVNFRSSRCN